MRKKSYTAPTLVDLGEVAEQTRFGGTQRFETVTTMHD
ncbi:MAG TPA: lasso RiPP family leader peptide-containing protein [Gemmatimonadaceae bacterium]